MENRAGPCVVAGSYFSTDVFGAVSHGLLPLQRRNAFGNVIPSSSVNSGNILRRSVMAAARVFAHRCPVLSVSEFPKRPSRRARGGRSLASGKGAPQELRPSARQ